MSTSTFTVAAERSAQLHPDLVGPVRTLQHFYLDPRVRRAQGLMQRNLHRKLCLRELAGFVAISSSRFSHLFKAQTGISPAQYLKHVRLRKAKDLLEGSILSIKEVAGRVGLDPSRLIKRFKEVYGVTPLRYRLQMAQADSVGPKDRENRLETIERAQDEPPGRLAPLPFLA